MTRGKATPRSNPAGDASAKGVTMPKFSPLVSALTPPPIPAVAAWAKMYEGGEGPLIDLSQAAPGYPPHADLLGWLSEAAGSPRFAGYGPIEANGLAQGLCRACVGALRCAAPPAATFTSPPAATRPSSRPFWPGGTRPDRAPDQPHYFNHETSLAMLGIETELVPCDAAAGFLPDVEAIAASLHRDVRALALVSPNNPTGAVYPKALLTEIGALCRDKGIWLISTRPIATSWPTKARRTISSPRENWQNFLVSLYSFSKSYCIPGHRLGAITGGVPLIQQVAKVMDNLQICAPRPAQIASPRRSRRSPTGATPIAARSLRARPR